MSVLLARGMSLSLQTIFCCTVFLWYSVVRLPRKREAHNGILVANIAESTTSLAKTPPQVNPPLTSWNNWKMHEYEVKVCYLVWILGEIIPRVVFRTGGVDQDNSTPDGIGGHLTVFLTVTWRSTPNGLFNQNSLVLSWPMSSLSLELIPT